MTVANDYKVPKDSETIKKIMQGFLGLGAVLIVLHFGVIGSVLPYVYSSDDLSACGARRVLSLSTHSFNFILFAICCVVCLFFMIIVNERLHFENLGVYFMAFIGAASLVMIAVSVRSFERVTHPPTLIGNVKECAYPPNLRPDWH